MKKKRILFCGYAPVHFLCFRPIQQMLARDRNMEINFCIAQQPTQENGFRRKTESLLRTFRIQRERVLTPLQMERESFDMVLCSFVSGAFPRSDRTRVHLFHGVSFRNMAVRRDVLIYDYLFNVGPYQMKGFEKSQLLRKGDPRMVPIGFPKLDKMVNGSLNRNAIIKRLGLTGKRPIILYAPTGQKNNSLEIMGEEVIQRLRKTGRYDLLIKTHDHPRDRLTDWPKLLRRFEDAHTKIISDFDVVPYLFVSDLLLTDASSVSNEYALLDRPMVFIDVPQMLESMREKGLLVDLDTWGRKGGVTVRWPDEVVDAVAWSLKHPAAKREIRQAMAKDMFFNPGSATEKAVAWIRNWFLEN